MGEAITYRGRSSGSGASLLTKIDGMLGAWAVLALVATVLRLGVRSAWPEGPAREILGYVLLIVQAGAALVWLGLVVSYLVRDLSRFSWTRVWAISGVCVRQSVRRRVLWITPLVMLGLVIVSQFQKAIDAQDAVRQTTKFCLFASGLVVVMVCLILACTNLPREIENRVIYTIATKPTTRLEIVLGKVVGFSCVAGLLLILMGVFTLVYLHVRDWRLRSEIRQAIDSGTIEAGPGRATSQYYLDNGTLHARVLGYSDTLNLFDHEPRTADDRWAPGGNDAGIVRRFTIDRSQIPQPAAGGAGAGRIGPGVLGASGATGGLIAEVDVMCKPVTRGPDARAATRAAGGDVSLALANLGRETIVPAGEIIEPSTFLPDGDQQTLRFFISSDALDKFTKLADGRFECLIDITGTLGRVYHIGEKGIRLYVADTYTTPGRKEITSEVAVAYVTRLGTYGQQLRGEAEPDGPVAVYSFRGESVPAEATGTYPFELRVGVERPDTAELATRVFLTFHNRKTNQTMPAIEVNPESNQPLYFDVPAAAVAGGDFDVVVQNKTSSWIGLRTGSSSSLKLVVSRQNFAWNLAKSLFVLWLLAVLVTAISVFCSTFLSWPIAVILTLVMMFSHWGAAQLADQGGGMSGRIATELFPRSTGAQTKAISQSVEALTRTLEVISGVLPDIGRFAAVEDIEQGVAIAPRVIMDSLKVALGFGLPLTVLSYVFLKRKEVAP